MAKNDKQDNQGSGEPAVDAYIKKLEETIRREQPFYIVPEKETKVPEKEFKAPKQEVKPAPWKRKKKVEPEPEPHEANAPPAPAETKPAAASLEPAPAPPAPASSPVPGQRAGVFEQGDILKMDDGTLAVYQGPVPGKEYDLVIFLQPDGRADARGIMIYAYDFEKIGNLPPLYFDKLRHLMQWNRDLVIYHLDRYEWCKHILFPTNPELMRAPDKTPMPHRTPPPRPHVPAEYQTGQPRPVDERPEQMLQKGRKLVLTMGAKEWHAVYWGKDDLGHIVAHQTHHDWSVLHLDLERFSNSIKFEGMLSPEEIHRMDESILSQNTE